MKIVGLITEYNPFHNGHKYHIEQAKKQTNADFVVVVMSGDFVQRGEPAIFPKSFRAKMALLNGADVVFQLPTYYSTSSASTFAYGAVCLLHKLGCIDSICFGSEDGHIKHLTDCATILLQEPPTFREVLKEQLKLGNSFPKAREIALSACMPKHSLPDFSPNNILGMEYIKSLLELNSTITPVTIKRQGAGYHDLDFSKEYCSASALRTTIGTDSVSSYASFIPQNVADLLTSDNTPLPLVLDNFSYLLNYKKLTCTCFSKYTDFSTHLEHRFFNIGNEFFTINQYISMLKSKEYTHSRIARALLHSLLNITKEKQDYFYSNGTIFYARLLGFQKQSSSVLKKIKECSLIPCITKLADAPNLLDDIGLELLNHDIFSSNLYRMVYYEKYKKNLPNEYQSPIIL